jgi:hypothetical protein
MIARDHDGNMHANSRRFFTAKIAATKKCGNSPRN